MIENGNVPQRPALSEADIADMEAFLTEMLVIYPVLDVRAFEPYEARPATSRLRLTGPDANATGDETAEGFLVHAGSAGSVARASIVPSTPTSVGDLRAQLMESGVLAADGESLRFTADYLFTSPSAAAAVILGRNANGRLEWRDDSGKTLKQIQSESVAPN